MKADREKLQEKTDSKWGPYQLERWGLKTKLDLI